MKNICKWKTSLIGQANGRKVVYLSANPNVCPLKAQFPLLCWILHNVTKCYSNNMIEGEFSLCICSLKPIIFEYCYDTIGYKTQTFV